MLGLRWFDRIVGILSTIILAHLLVPDQFGIFALASVIVGFADMLLDLGVHVALIQNLAPQRDDYDAAWTLRIAQSLLAAGALAIAAPLLSSALEQPQLEALLPWLGGALVVASMENIGIIDFQKKRSFDRDFFFFFWKRIVGVTVTILAAIVLRSFWALAIGTIAHRVAGVALSYIMHPYRPHPSLRAATKIWHVSKWMLLQNLGSFLEQRLDKIVLAKRAGASTIGAYSMADDIAAIPGTELLAPLNRTLFPSLVAHLAEANELRHVFLLALGLQCLIAFPTAVGLMLVAEPMVIVLLGPNWTEAVPVLKLLSFGGVLAATTASGRYLLLAAGDVRLLAGITWLQVGLFALIAALMFPLLTAEYIAASRVAAAAATVFVIVGMVLHRFPQIRLQDIGRTVTRPVVATGLMALAVHGARAVFPANNALSLSVAIGVGVIGYVAAIGALWFVAGRPDGAESFLLEQLRRGSGTLTAFASLSSGSPPASNDYSASWPRMPARKWVRALLRRGSTSDGRTCKKGSKDR